MKAKADLKASCGDLDHSDRGFHVTMASEGDGFSIDCEFDARNIAEAGDQALKEGQPFGFFSGKKAPQRRARRSFVRVTHDAIQVVRPLARLWPRVAGN